MLLPPIQRTPINPRRAIDKTLFKFILNDALAPSGLNILRVAKVVYRLRSDYCPGLVIIPGCDTFVVNVG